MLSISCAVTPLSRVAHDSRRRADSFFMAVLTPRPRRPILLLDNDVRSRPTEPRPRASAPAPPTTAAHPPEHRPPTKNTNRDFACSGHSSSTHRFTASRFGHQQVHHSLGSGLAACSAGMDSALADRDPGRAAPGAWATAGSHRRRTADADPSQMPGQDLVGRRIGFSPRTPRLRLPFVEARHRRRHPRHAGLRHTPTLNLGSRGQQRKPGTDLPRPPRTNRVDHRDRRDDAVHPQPRERWARFDRGARTAAATAATRSQPARPGDSVEFVPRRRVGPGTRDGDGSGHRCAADDPFDDVC
jgi:hypothetical protein